MASLSVLWLFIFLSVWIAKSQRILIPFTGSVEVYTIFHNPIFHSMLLSLLSLLLVVVVVLLPILVPFLDSIYYKDVHQKQSFLCILVTSLYFILIFLWKLISFTLSCHHFEWQISSFGDRLYFYFSFLFLISFSLRSHPPLPLIFAFYYYYLYFYYFKSFSHQH